MKTILVVVAFATFTVLPSFASSQATEGPSYSRAYPEQKKALNKSLGGGLPSLQRIRVELQSACVECGPNEAMAVQYRTRLLSRLPWRQWRLSQELRSRREWPSINSRRCDHASHRRDAAV